MTDYVLAIDAGTTGVTTLLFDKKGQVVRKLNREFTQHYPKPGWVEHDAEEIWSVTKGLIHEVLGDTSPKQVAAIGITNQRETTVLWDAETRKPFHHAIVWQCRRTADACDALQKHSGVFRAKTGLVVDAYFSGTKVAWILDNVPAARAAADAGTARFGTIDTWLVERLTRGEAHVTDPTNASRTLMFDIHKREWDDELLGLLGVPRSVLPEVKPSAGVFAMTDPEVFGAAVPIAGIAGDQQAALFGQGCVSPGQAKNTYGTGCFALLNAGTEPVSSSNGLLTTIGCDAEGKPVYCLEGSVFVGGAVIQWLRDELKLIPSAPASETLAADHNNGVYLVPAFVGLGTPYWDQDARGVITGLTRGANASHLVRAALESIAYQSRDLIEALQADVGEAARLTELRVDGGACMNEVLMQFQSDILGLPLVRPSNVETTAQGAAFLAGIGSGFWGSFAEVEQVLSVDKRFEPKMSEDERASLYAGWKDAVARCRSDR